MIDEDTDAPVGVTALDALYWIPPSQNPLPDDDDDLVDKLLHMAGATD